MESKVILSHRQIELILRRFALCLAEYHLDFKNCALIGLQPRGVEVSRRVLKKLDELFPGHGMAYGELDSSFYRDDVGHGEQIIIPKPTDIKFSTAGKHIILVDDVLYTGRSVRSALEALMDYGRPASVELMTLVDRSYQRELPINADHVGITVDTRSTGEKVRVEWNENDYKIWLLQKNQ